MDIDCPCSVQHCLNLVNSRRLINSVIYFCKHASIKFYYEFFYSETYEILGILLYLHSAWTERDVVQGFSQGEQGNPSLKEIQKRYKLDEQIVQRYFFSRFKDKQQSRTIFLKILVIFYGCSLGETSGCHSGTIDRTSSMKLINVCKHY